MPLRPRRGVAGLHMLQLAGLSWYALQVAANAEFAVAAQLERRDLVATVPERIEWRQVNRFTERKHKVTYSLLPRYVFIGFGLGAPTSYLDELIALAALQRDLTLIHSVVGMDGQPRRLRAMAVALFLRDLGQVQAPDAHRFMPTHREFGVGDDVVIASGPFEGNVVRVEEIAGDAARILIPLFGGQEVRVPLANLEKAD